MSGTYTERQKYLYRKPLTDFYSATGNYPVGFIAVLRGNCSFAIANTISICGRQVLNTTGNSNYKLQGYIGVTLNLDRITQVSGSGIIPVYSIINGNDDIEEISLFLSSSTSSTAMTITFQNTTFSVYALVL